MRLAAAILLAALIPPAVAAAQPAQPAQPAQTPATPEVTDERCLLVMLALSNSSDQNASRMGQSGVMYFAGRLTGRNNNFDFSLLKPIAATMNNQTAQADLQQRCGPLVDGSLQKLQAALAPPAGTTAPGAKPATPPPKPPPKR